MIVIWQCKNGTKSLNLAVKRHINRFPERFMFQLTEEELEKLNWFQVETGYDKRKHSSTLPYAFSEQGVAMLSSILRTEAATEISIKIMDAFVKMRHYISNGLLTPTIEHKLLDHDKRISLLEETFDNFKEKNNHIFFEGQIYDAYSKILDIFNDSKKEIIIIFS